MRTFLLLTLVLTANVFSYSLTNQEKDDFKASFNGEIIDFYGEGKAFLPNDIKGHILSSSESLYLNGYTDSIGYAKIKCKSDELFKIHDFIKSTSHPKDEECNFNSFSNTSCNTQVNLNAYKNVTNQNCSNAGFARIGPVVKKIDTSFGPKPLSKRFELWGKIYSRYQEFLIKTLNEHPGVRKNIRENSTVSACKEGLVRDYDFRSLSGASCKSTQVSCSDHLDCCSGRCIKSDVTDSTGQCSEAMTCYRPINLNRRCGDISGDGYNNTHCKSGECIEIDYNSSDMGALKRAGQSCSENMQCRSDLCSSGKCTEQSKCLECAANGESPSSSKSCCPGLIKSIKNKCIPDFPALILPTVQNERNIIEKVFNFIIPSALAEDPNEGDCSGVGTNLSPEDERAYEEELNRCMRIEDTEGRDACLVAAAKARQEKLDQQAQDSGCTWNREKYRDKYNTIEIKSKTYSNVEKCEFNSFNDTWKDMSNVQRNAELVVRAFEYVYSGAGTEDYWIDSNGKNINTRASEIAKGLRKARADFIKKMDETDIAMTCQCINVFGISNMPAEKQAFYNTSACDEFRVETAPIGAIVQETPDNGQGAEEGESSLATSDEVAEIDAGATGLSLEAALVEWLRIKYENQMERFELNSKLEQQMSEIVEQLDNQNFQSAKEEPNHLYNFTVYKPRGFWRFLQQAFTWPVYVIKRVFNGRDAANEMFMGIFGSTSFDNGVLSERLKDTPVPGYNGEWHARGRLFRKYRDYSRDLVYPHYINDNVAFMGISATGVTTDLRCDIYAYSSSCLKNAFKTKFEEEKRYLIDIKNPLFVNYSNTMLKQNYVTKVNNGFKRVKEKLLSMKPGGKRHVRYLNENHLVRPEVVRLLLPAYENYAPREFTEELRKKFIAGVTKYSKCKVLNECNVTAEDYKDDYGFGELFENDEDIKHFAEYAYQHHFHWPSLSATSFLGYPLMAQRAYFQTVFHNIRLVGSLAAAQGAGYGDAYFKYKADWQKRKSNYDSLGKATMGSGSRNVKYSKEFLDTFNMLDFSTGDGVAAFDSSFNNLKNKGNLSSFEKSALEAGRNTANRALSSQKKRENYLKQTKDDPRAKLKQDAQAKLLNSLGSPLNNNSLSVGGTDLGNTGDMYKSGGGLTANALSKELSDSEKDKSKNKANNNMAAFDPSKYQNNSGASYGSGGYGQSQSYSSYDDQETYSDKKGSIGANQKASGMSQEEIERMLSASQGDKDLNSTDGDNIFTAVSKAYKRNYDVFFARKSNKREKIKSQIDKDLDSEEKSKLKKLLGN